MRGLLLAAGKGMRLRPITDTVPKSLVPVHGRPLLDYWLELLFDAGVERVLINTHWLANKVRDHIECSCWRSRIDLVHEPDLLGTGGTLLANHAYFGEEALLLAHADNLTDFDVGAFMSAHAARPRQCLMTMLAFRTDDPSSCGILEVDERGIVLAFHEKIANPPGNLANGAVYIIEPHVIEDLAAYDRPFVDLSVDVIPGLVNKILAFETTGYHRDIGNAESLQRAHFEFSANRRSDRVMQMVGADRNMACKSLAKNDPSERA
jgi:mannose-1-phosphate guanylyltransferase